MDLEKIKTWLIEQTTMIEKTNCPEAALLLRLESYKKEWYQLLIEDRGIAAVRSLCQEIISSSFTGEKYLYK